MTRLVECIPNFSCSKEKDEAAYNALVEVANSVPGCTLFDAQTDGNHNRCVFTLIGTPEAVEEVAFRLTKKAAEVIDMTKHHGEHSRMGATDVIPFVPTVNVTVEECVEISKRLGKRIWEELQIPSFLYEDSATSPDRVNLANVRKGQFEGMPEKLLLPEWAPDFGERKIHPTAGITAIGARMPLVAFNINLATSDVNIAKKIAKVIRGSSGGFKCCKAMGFMLEDRGIAQVSMNMVNYEVTPLTVVYEMVDSLAKRYGTYIVGSELVGLTPAKALLDCAEYYLKLENLWQGFISSRDDEPLRRMAAKHDGVAAPVLESLLGLESDERFLYGSVFTCASVERLADFIDPGDVIPGETCELVGDGMPEGEPLPPIVDRAALLALADEMDAYAPHEDGRARKTVALVRSEVEGYARRIREACGATKDGSNEIGE